MALWQETITLITPRNKAVEQRISQQWQDKTLYGTYGKLVDMVAQYASATEAPVEDVLPSPKPCMIIAASDHGIARVGVSAYPIETTIGMTKNYLIPKGAGANALANYCGADMEVVDMGIAADMSDVPGLRHHKIAFGTKNFLEEPAMTKEQAIQGIETGIALVTEKIDAGYNAFLVGEMGIANTTSSALMVAKFAGLTADEATGRGSNISDERMKVKQKVVHDTLVKYEYIDKTDGFGILQAVGGFEFACIVGIILGAAAYKALVVIDGFNTTACALVAQSLAPASREYVMASHLSAEKAHVQALKALQLDAYINLGLCLGEASGGSVQMKMLGLAVGMYNTVVKGHVERASAKAFVTSREADVTPRNADVTSTEERNQQEPMNVPPLSSEAAQACRKRIDCLTKPIYSLAQLEVMAERLAGMYAVNQPQEMKKAILVFGADHAIDGPQNHTKGGESVAVWQALLANHGATNAVASSLGAQVVAVDVGLEAATKQRVKGTQGSHFFAREEAMGAETLLAAMQAGKLAVRKVFAEGVQAIGLGNVGERAFLSALAVTAGVTKYPLSRLLTTNECTLSVQEKAERLEMTLQRYGLGTIEEHRAEAILRSVGSPDIAAMVGAVLEAASCRMAIVFDNAVTGAAVLLAREIDADVMNYIFPSVMYEEPIHQSQMEYLGVKGFLQYDFTVEEGLGSALGLSLLDASLHMLNDMKTFDEAAVVAAEDGPGNGKQI